MPAPAQQGGTTGSGSSALQTATTQLLRKVSSGKNSRARDMAALHGIQSQLQTALNTGGIEGVRAWIDNFNDTTINSYCDAMNVGGGE